jgi:PAS domain S-box-containing protein
MNQNILKSQQSRALPFAVVIGIAVAVVFSVTIFISYQYYQKLKTQQLQSELSLVTDNIRKIMTNSNLAAFSVGLTINTHQDTITNFEYVAKEIMNRHPYLFGVQILRKGEIQYVYPYEIHKSVIGFDILKDSSTRIEAKKAIDNKKIYYAGPLDLQQGGKGIIGRLPIYHEGEFWGFSAVLIKIDDFFKATGIQDSNVENVKFIISKINPNTGKEEYFTSNQLESHIFLDYKFDESGWRVSAYYKQDFFIYFLLLVVVFLALSSSIGSGLYTYQILKKPEQLEDLLSKKTKEIEENNEYLTSMVAAIPDLIFIYDKDSKYLDFHAYQNNLLFYKPKDFIGKSTFQLFDKEFAQDIYNAIQNALNTAQIIQNSYYLDFKEGRKYFESRYKAINSEKVLAVVREVTESKLSAQKLAKSEQKYRNLVSQASDAIFLADEKANLLELNQKGMELTAIPLNRIKEIKLSDIIELNSEKSPSFIDKIHEKGDLFEEVTLVTLDNKKIPVEINCKITSERQIHGIIRDITARNNFIKSIQQQNEKLKKIAWVQSHEVRAPLARLLGLLDFLEKYDSINQSEKLKIINSIRDSALELDVIIRDVVKRTELAEIITSRDEYIS